MNTQTLAALTNKLQAPMIVSDILTGKDKNEDTHYALSALISEMQPDAAILAIALSMRNIVGPYLKASPSLQMTEIECTKIIEDYAHQWSTQPLTAETSAEESFDTLEKISEDLEYIEELLDLNMNYLQAKDLGATELCKLLKSQANTHRMIADLLCSTIETDTMPAILTPEETLSLTGDNVVAFPMKK